VAELNELKGKGSVKKENGKTSGTDWKGTIPSTVTIGLQGEGERTDGSKMGKTLVLQWVVVITS